MNITGKMLSELRAKKEEVEAFEVLKAEKGGENQRYWDSYQRSRGFRVKNKGNVALLTKLGYMEKMAWTANTNHGHTFSASSLDDLLEQLVNHEYDEQITVNIIHA